MKLAVLYPMTEHFLRRAHEACMRLQCELLIATPQPGRWAAAFPDLANAIFEVPPIGENDAVAAAQVEAHHVDGVLPGGEFSTEVTDGVAQRLRLPGCDPVLTRALRDKSCMREVFADAGVRQPRVLLRLPAGGDALRLSQDLAFPVIFKPTDMAGSMFVRICHDASEVAAVLASMSTVTRSSSTGLRFTGDALIEELVVGPEYSCEVVVAAGAPLASVLTTKYLSPEPECNEVAHLSGDVLPDDEALEVAELVRRVVLASGLHAGVLHVEFRMSETGPVLIEAAPRVAGDRISQLVEMRYGWHLEEAAVRARLALPVGGSRRHGGDAEHYYGVRFLFGADETPPSSAVTTLVFEAPQGRRADGSWTTNVGERAGFRLCKAPVRDDLHRYLLAGGKTRP